MRMPCTECTCGLDCQCGPGAPGCDPCSEWQRTNAPAAPAASSQELLALPAPEDISQLITLDVASGQPVVLDQFGPVVVNTDGTLSRITNWDRMSSEEQAVAKRRISKRNVERLRQFHAAGDLKEELVAALSPQPRSDS
mmetsp:Transcript_26025/g.59106  ORF Transcript_26025/g.59106 Transcript_26025/m.59106 type:complete len:139 (-) Transcript_26025:167-583(-)